MKMLALKCKPQELPVMWHNWNMNICIPEIYQCEPLSVTYHVQHLCCGQHMK